MAIYRSTVNDVIVKTVAFVEVSANRPWRMQKDCWKGYDVGYQILYTSGGIPGK